MKLARAAIEVGGGQRGFGPVHKATMTTTTKTTTSGGGVSSSAAAAAALLVVDCASVSGKINLKYDAWQREFQVRSSLCVYMCGGLCVCVRVRVCVAVCGCVR
jgi:hypothetical protein